MGKILDLVGKKYNKLTVVKYIENGKWECLCDCGRTTILMANKFRSGHTKSCGCMTSYQDGNHIVTPKTNLQFRVWNNYYVFENGDIFNLRMRKIKTWDDKNGRKRFGAFINGIRQPISVHKVVYIAFHGEIPDGLVCRHIDNNFKNNHFTNIEIGTQKQNIYDKLRHGTWQAGEKHPRSKYSDDDVTDVRAMLEDSKNAHEISRKLNFPVSFIYDVKYGRRKTFQERVKEASI